MTPEHHLTFGPFRWRRRRAACGGATRDPLAVAVPGDAGLSGDDAGRLVTKYECQRIHEVYQLNYYTTEIRSKRGVRIGGRGEIPSSRDTQHSTVFGGTVTRCTTPQDDPV